MSKKKLLIHEVFNKIKKGSEKDTKGGLASDLADYLDEHLDFMISKRTLIRYYEAYIEGNEEVNIELYVLNRLSQYLDYNDFEDFSRTFEKEGDDACKTTVKIDVDNEEVSLAERFMQVVVNINNSNSNNNEPTFKISDAIKQNGFGIMEFLLVILLLTGNIVFSNTKKPSKNSSTGLAFLFNIISNAEKNYMYWDGEKFIGTDSSYISPEFEVVAMNKFQLDFLQRITRKDTMTVENSLGRTWYSKFNGDVEFFTADGIDPDTKKELKKTTPLIIEKYAGKNADSLYVE